MVIVAFYTAVVAAIEIHLLREYRMSTSGDSIEKALKNTTIMHSILGFVLSLLVVAAGRVPHQYGLRPLVGRS